MVRQIKFFQPPHCENHLCTIALCCYRYSHLCSFLSLRIQPFVPVPICRLSVYVCPLPFRLLQFRLLLFRLLNIFMSSTTISSTPVLSTVVSSTQHFYVDLLLFAALLLNFDWSFGGIPSRNIHWHMMYKYQNQNFLFFLEVFLYRTWRIS